MYEYRVLAVTKVVDGDTFDAIIDLGFGLSAHFRFRLAGCNAPEMSMPDGPVAKAFAKTWFDAALDAGYVAPVDKRAPTLVVRTHPFAPSTTGIGDGLYGRWVAYAVVHTPGTPGVDAANLTDALITARLAVPLDPFTPLSTPTREINVGDGGSVGEAAT